MHLLLLDILDQVEVGLLQFREGVSHFEQGQPVDLSLARTKDVGEDHGVTLLPHHLAGQDLRHLFAGFILPLWLVDDLLHLYPQLAELLVEGWRFGDRPLPSDVLLLCGRPPGRGAGVEVKGPILGGLLGLRRRVCGEVVVVAGRFEDLLDHGIA